MLEDLSFQDDAESYHRAKENSSMKDIMSMTLSANNPDSGWKAISKFCLVWVVNSPLDGANTQQHQFTGREGVKQYDS